MSDQYYHSREQTLADFFCRFNTPEARADLEAFRIDYEREHGPTDLTLRYTTQLSEDAQRWLIRTNVDRYMEGAPPFVRKYMELSVDAGIEKGGSMDSLSEPFIKYHMRRRQNRGRDSGPSR